MPTNTGPTQLSMSMFEPLEDTTCHESTRSLVDFPASPILLRAADLARMIAGTSGPTSGVLLATFDQERSYWRMCQVSLPLWEPESLQILPQWVMWDGQALYERPTPALPTSAPDGFAWPTPRAEERQQHNSQDNDVALSRAVKVWPTPAARDWKSGNASQETTEKNSRPLNEAVLNWPTPRTSNDSIYAEDRENFDRRETRDNKGRRTLPLEAGAVPDGQQLNPAFVEALMGYPVGWTSLDGPHDQANHSMSGNHRASPAGSRTASRDSRRSETPSFRKSSIPLRTTSTNGYRRKTRAAVRARRGRTTGHLNMAGTAYCGLPDATSGALARATRSRGS